MENVATEPVARVRLFDRRALEERDYWMRALGRDFERASPPADPLPRPADPPPDATLRFEIGGETFAALERLTRGNAFLAHAVLTAALEVCLHRYAGVAGPLAVSVGTPPRLAQDGSPVPPNLLCIANQVDGAASFRALLTEVRQTLLDACARQGYPFGQVLRDLGIDDEARRAALAAVTLATDGVHGELAGGTRDLALRVARREGALEGWATYSPARYRAATVERFLRHFATLVGSLLADVDAPVGAAAMIGPAERRQVVEEWNPAASPFPARSVAALFAQVAARAPHAVAVSAGDAALGYGELDARAARLARRLRALGVGPESRVGLSVERGIEMVVGMLAVLKAGGAYVPLDPSYPPERLAWMRDDAGCAVVLTTAALAAAFPAGPATLVLLDQAPDEADEASAAGAADLDAAAPDQLAYVIYTSGSTGTPKGVMVTHRAIARLVRGTDYAPLDQGDVVAQVSNHSFDAATFEVWGALLNGARLVIVPREETLDPRAFVARLRGEGVTTLFLTTALFNRVAQEVPDGFRTLRHLLFGGEAVDPAQVRRVLEAGGPARLLHVYGPTENTTYSSWQRVTEVPDGAVTVPIGRAIASTRLYVVDAGGAPAPAGVPGELWVAGDGVARGYLDRPAQTAAAFVPEPFSGAAGARAYRTGDRVRWTAEGAIEFLGRADQQVKIRGFRVEPGEVEAALAALPQVREAVVVVREDPGAPGERRLVAYAVPAVGATPGGTELREALKAHLPAHLLPAVVAVLPALPLTPNGKVDRAALPAAEVDGGEQYVAPRTPAEEILAEIWAELLRLPRVGVHDDFFVLGGHSLLATQIVARARRVFAVEVPMRALFDTPTVAGLAHTVEALLRDGAGGDASPITPAPRDRPLPLSFGQQRLWFMDQLHPDSPAFNVPNSLRMRGPLDVAALRGALEALVARHEALRTAFRERADGPVQVVLPPGPVPLPRVDLRGLEPRAREAAAWELTRAEVSRRFDLSRGPLLRALLLRLDQQEHVFAFTLHHIAADGWSLDVLVREMAELYAAHTAGRAPALPPLPVQYPDYAVWQRARMEGALLERQLAWWKSYLAGAPALLDVPTDRPREPGQDAMASVRAFALTPGASQALRALGRAEGATLFMVLLAAWQALLARYAAQDDVVVGTPIAGRVREELEGLIGFFVNMLPLRASLAGGPSFQALVGRVREATLGAFAHQELPFERLVEELGDERSLTETPIFQAVFVLRGAEEEPAPALGPLELRSAGERHGFAKYDLDLAMVDAGTHLTAGLHYRAGLFAPETAQRMADSLRVFLEAAAADPHRPVALLPLLAPDDRARVLAQGHGGEPAAPPASLHALVAAQAARTPGAVAVVAGGERLTYAELDARAARLARRLRRRGAGPEARVGVCVERSPGLLVAILGVLKSGAAYLPLDPGHPAERLAATVRDAGCRIVVAGPGLEPPFAGVETVAPDAGDDADAADDARSADGGADPDNLAYVIYTSGSTGTPKGVMVTHRSAAGYVAALRRLVPLGPDDRVLQFAPASFDTSVEEIFPALAAGAALVLRDEDMLASPAVFLDTCARWGITVLDLPVAWWHELADAVAAGAARFPASVHTVLIGGEAALAERVNAWNQAVGPGVRLLDGYGPTEATVVVTFQELTGRRLDGRRPVPVGHPVAGVRAWLLDPALEPVPQGVAGEVYVGGAGVARGYLGRPALTAAHFRPDPHAGTPGARMYATGDLARRLPDGALEYGGRADRQVKVRGFRVEPAEVEAVLAGHPGVREAVVVARPDARGRTRLVAYVVPAREGLHAADLRAPLRAAFPEPLLPSAFVLLDALPLTASHKVDRQALPAPDWTASDEAYVAPRTPVEEKLCAIWAEILGAPRIGVNDNFFELGGHSLLATQVIARARSAFRIDLPLAALFRAPSVAGFAAEVEAELLGALDPAELARRLEGLEEMSDEELQRMLDGAAAD